MTTASISTVVRVAAQLAEHAVAAVEQEADARLLDQVAGARAVGVLPRRRLPEHRDLHRPLRVDSLARTLPRMDRLGSRVAWARRSRGRRRLDTRFYAAAARVRGRARRGPPRDRALQQATARRVGARRALPAGALGRQRHAAPHARPRDRAAGLAAQRRPDVPGADDPGADRAAGAPAPAAVSSCTTTRRRPLACATSRARSATTRATTYALRWPWIRRRCRPPSGARRPPRASAGSTRSAAGSTRSVLDESRLATARSRDARLVLGPRRPDRHRRARAGAPGCSWPRWSTWRAPLWRRWRTPRTRRRGSPAETWARVSTRAAPARSRSSAPRSTRWRRPWSPTRPRSSQRAGAAPRERRARRGERRARPGLPRARDLQGAVDPRAVDAGPRDQRPDAAAPADRRRQPRARAADQGAPARGRARPPVALRRARRHRRANARHAHRARPRRDRGGRAAPRRERRADRGLGRARARARQPRRRAACR